ncbi:MAG: hypothetical protein RLZZ324_1232 [Candidatus Parcubacteria bacterium]
MRSCIIVFTIGLTACASGYVPPIAHDVRPGITVECAYVRPRDSRWEFSKRLRDGLISEAERVGTIMDDASGAYTLITWTDDVSEEGNGGMCGAVAAVPVRGTDTLLICTGSWPRAEVTKRRVTDDQLLTDQELDLLSYCSNRAAAD